MNQSDYSSNRDRAASRSEHVFVVGNDIGQGTSGLGEEKCRAASVELQKTYMSNYWSRRANQSQEQKAREVERLRKIEEAQAGSPRQRMHAALSKRARDIERMTVERKANEAKFKEAQKQDQAERNAIISAEKEVARKQHEAAKEQREIAKERALVKLRKERAELLKVREMEADAEQIVASEHYTKMRQLHDVWKARAEEEKRERFEERCREVKEKNQKQHGRVEEHKQIVTEIVHLKHDMIDTHKTRTTHAHARVRNQREIELVGNANELREGVKKRAKIRKDHTDRDKTLRRSHARSQKEEAEDAREEYRAAQEKKFDELRREAKEQKMISQEEMEAEKEEQRQSHQEYIALMKSLVSRRGGNSNSSKSPSPTRQRGHPQAMSPSKLDSPFKK